MWFFTGKGDSGDTSLYKKSQVSKANPILELIGTIDEVNAHIGLAISFIEQPELKEDLHQIQATLSLIMGKLAGASEITIHDFDIAESTKWLEIKLSSYGREVDDPKRFVLPGVTVSGAALDICRTVVRRAERRVVGILDNSHHNKKDIIAYFNRLSSFFYILRMFADMKFDIQDNLCNKI